jgi:excisionase family DNA binding protein
MSGKLLTSREAARRLRVTPATVLRWARNGEIEAMRLPDGDWRFEPRSVSHVAVKSRQRAKGKEAAT